ncbi:MAG TPA: sulfurtransferase-like selenium metabolism protein YedF [Candidatus Anoxymicrobiaceae bacterium]|jgi:selenium metabolism protein YedF
MEVDIDCTGLLCPEPVLRTKKHLESAPGPFTVQVDNETARDNVSRFARTSGCEVSVLESDGKYQLTVTPPGDTRQADLPEVEEAWCPPVEKKTVLFISTDEVGKGERELGQTLMKMFLYTATESEIPPSTLIFINSGVRLVTENEETAAHVKKLEEAGAEVMVCGTCLDYYGLKEVLKAGRVSNMYDIQSAMIGADLLVSI